MKPLAPYGTHLVSRLRNKSPYEIVLIFMGKKGSERAASFQPHLPFTLYLPHQVSPLKFEWPLRNCDVYLVDTDHSQLSFVRFCALTFFSHGANKITYVSPSKSYVIEKGL
jgi:hypothetical protein